ncbi:MAG: Hsp20/alpha crystallin family protein [Candidatus Micrarchaeales archaeon]|jgi:HSP20 family protein|uniref:Heat shock protein Hsp20 n=1 Tax=Candidatus Micrarchaeum acidiphilum ARMAN-2 TaxID=425595 RepID=C7DHB3_MICA2|nr:MAG: heat shock protein Hsp20 [Candidatus Micrarchaeum acidiphilum ARMAN-2]MCW6160582.1 Hsp20/alpha crystallin family protein [Candidatus Micrarchaeales archaeon]
MSKKFEMVVQMKTDRNEKQKKEIVAYDPFGVLTDMNRAFNSFIGLGPKKMVSEFMNNGMRMPEADIVDNGDSLTIKIDMPGVDKKDIKLKVTNTRIIVSAEKNQEKEQNDKGFYSRERSSVGYYRAIELPEPVIAAKSKAKYDNGTLTIIADKKDRENEVEPKID